MIKDLNLCIGTSGTAPINVTDSACKVSKTGTTSDTVLSCLISRSALAACFWENFDIDERLVRFQCLQSTAIVKPSKLVPTTSISIRGLANLTLVRVWYPKDLRTSDASFSKSLQERYVDTCSMSRLISSASTAAWILSDPENLTLFLETEPMLLTSR